MRPGPPENIRSSAPRCRSSARSLRSPRRPRRPEGARCRGRQRQRLACGRAPLVRRRRDRLCAGAARPRPRARRCRTARHRVPRGRCGSAAVCEQRFRHGRLDLRRDVHARSGPGRGRNASRVPAGRQDRPRQLDAGGLHRQSVQDIGAYMPPPAGAKSPALWGTRERIAQLFEPQAHQIVAQERNFVFRYRSPEHMLECSGPPTGRLKTFGALNPDADGASPGPCGLDRPVQPVRFGCGGGAEHLPRNRDRAAMRCEVSLPWPSWRGLPPSPRRFASRPMPFL